MDARRACRRGKHDHRRGVEVGDARHEGVERLGVGAHESCGASLCASGGVRLFLLVLLLVRLVARDRLLARRLESDEGNVVGRGVRLPAGLDSAAPRVVLVDGDGQRASEGGVHEALSLRVWATLAPLDDVAGEPGRPVAEVPAVQQHAGRLGQRHDVEHVGLGGRDERRDHLAGGLLFGHQAAAHPHHVHEVGQTSLREEPLTNPTPALAQASRHQVDDVVAGVLRGVGLREVGQDVRHECVRLLGVVLSWAAVGEMVAKLQLLRRLVVLLVFLRPLRLRQEQHDDAPRQRAVEVRSVLCSFCDCAKCAEFLCE